MTIYDVVVVLIHTQRSNVVMNEVTSHTVIAHYSSRDLDVAVNVSMYVLPEGGRR